jgi:hypothetical protein
VGVGPELIDLVFAGDGDAPAGGDAVGEAASHWRTSRGAVAMDWFWDVLFVTDVEYEQQRDRMYSQPGY